jgi:hypothetical protein
MSGTMYVAIRGIHRRASRVCEGYDGVVQFS